MQNARDTFHGCINMAPPRHQISHDIHTLKTEFLRALEAATTLEALEKVRVEFLGRKGRLGDLVGSLKDLSDEEKRSFGPELNALKAELHARFEAQREQLEKPASSFQKPLDVTAYDPGYHKGSLHPYTHVTTRVENIFMSMGFEIAEGPEIENEWANFEALNIPETHPARELTDTFWLTTPEKLLRTHTSTVQIRTMEKKRPPIAIVTPGRVFRHEATDASHDVMFLQCEGLLVDRNISMAHLFGTIQTFLRTFFEKEDIHIRTRPSFFPFVEPGVEFDMSCPFCESGCSTCKKTGFIEIAGAGLVHPRVLSACGIDPKIYSGFAFGMGLTRLVMMKNGIHDIRLLHENRLDFLRQF